jgi:hypothetical protein
MERDHAHVQMEDGDLELVIWSLHTEMEEERN